MGNRARNISVRKTVPLPTAPARIPVPSETHSCSSSLYLPFSSINWFFFFGNFLRTTLQYSPVNAKSTINLEMSSTYLLKLLSIISVRCGIYYRTSYWILSSLYTIVKVKRLENIMLKINDVKYSSSTSTWRVTLLEYKEFYVSHIIWFY
jgi:hypothetical protein